MNILNNELPWDGSHLGSFVEAITSQWSVGGINYYGLTLPSGWSTIYPGGIIYCNLSHTKDAFPCIVEDLKSLFGLPKRGVHRINIDNKEYVLFFVPISINGNVIWETPLNQLDNKHALRRDLKFRRNVQKLIAFCDILGLVGTSETAIRIRQGTGNEMIPINTNETTTSIIKSDTYDYSILTKTLFTKWFGEETSLGEVIKEMVQPNSPEYKFPIIRKEENTFNLSHISYEIGRKVGKIIKKYNRNYIWYRHFIVDRMSRHLLAES